MPNHQSQYEERERERERVNKSRLYPISRRASLGRNLSSHKSTDTIDTDTRAFTLIEMLLVIAIIAILAGIVIVAINPGRQLAQARNAQRQSDLKAIFEATQQYYIKNRTWPDSDMASSLYQICDSGDVAGDGTATGGAPDTCDEDEIDLSNLVPDFLTAIPSDPLSGAIYAIAKSTNNRLSLTAPSSTEYSLDLVAIGTTTASATTIPPACSGECATISESLIAYYTFDNDTLPTAIDEMGSHNGTYVGSATVAEDCDSGYGSCLQLSGENSYINLNRRMFSTSQSLPYTIVARVKVAKTSSNQFLVSQFISGNAYRFTTQIAANTGYYCYFQSNMNRRCTTSNVGNSTWNYIATGRDENHNVLMYLNGVSQGSSASINNPMSDTNTLIGYPNLGGGPFTGLIDEVMIFDRALTSDEVNYIKDNQEMFKL